MKDISIRFIKTIVKIFFFPKYYFKIFKNDLRALLGKNFGVTKTIFIAGYPKSGTTWAENFVSNIPGYNPRVLFGSKEIIRSHNLPYNAFKMIPSFGHSAIKTHILPDYKNIKILQDNKINKVIIMFRDPRDIAVSQYYHVLKNNPWLKTDSFYADYTKMRKSEALQHSIDIIVSDFALWVKGWLNTKEKNIELECMIIKYEDLILNPESVFKNLLDFYGIILNDIEFNKVILKSNKKSKSILSLLFHNNLGSKSTKRKGVCGEWKKELNSKHKDSIKNNLGDLLIELGYEYDKEW
jgi:hypothetical protein